VNPKSLNNLQPFKKGYDPKRNLVGPPPKLFSKLAGFGYTKSEISDTLMTIAALTVKQIQAIIKNPDCSILEQIIAKALLKDHERGSIWNTEIIINH